MRTVIVLFILSSLFTALPTHAAEQACEPHSQTTSTLTAAQQAKAQTKWKRAIDQDKIEDIKQLLSQVDVQLTNDKGKTALMAAVKMGDYCLMQTLLQQGLKISDQGYTGGTTLMYAVLGNQTEMISRVLSYQPNLNAQSTNGWTAVMIAAAKGFDTAISVLHNAGANVNLADVYGWSPLMRAIDNKHSGVVNYLLSQPEIDVSQVNENGSTALHIAAQSGDSPAVNALLKHGVPMNVKDKNGYTAASIAEASKHSAIAQQILRLEE